MFIKNPFQLRFPVLAFARLFSGCLLFVLTLSTAWAAESGDAVQGTKPVEAIPRVEEKNWITQAQEVLSQPRNSVYVIDGVATLDNTARLPRGYADVAHVLERDVLPHDLVITLRNGRFQLYDRALDRSLVEGVDSAQAPGFWRRLGDGFTGVFGQDRLLNKQRSALQKVIDRLNDGKGKDLSFERKFTELQQAIEPIVKQNQASVAVVLREAHSVLPKEGEGGRLDKAATSAAEYFRDLSTRYDYAAAQGQKPFTTVLVADSELGLHPSFVQAANYEKIQAGLPNLAEREALLEEVLKTYPETQRTALESKLFEVMDRDNFLRRTHGSSRSGVLRLLFDHLGSEGKAGSSTKALSLKAVKAAQADSILKSSGGMISSLDIKEGISRDEIVGASGKRTLEYLDGLGQLVRDGRYSHMPYGFLVGGPPGVGKTFPFEVIAGETNFPLSFYVIRFEQANSKWVGELAKNLATIGQIARESPPGTVFLFDEIISTLDGAKGEGAGASAINEFRKFIRELSEDLKGTGKMIGYMDSRMGFEVAKINPVLESDELSRFTSRLVVEPVWDPLDVSQILEVQMKRYDVSAADRVAALKHLSENPKLFEYFIPTGRYIEDLARELGRRRAQSPQEDIRVAVEGVLGDFVPLRDQNWYAKWVASWFLYNPRDPMPSYVKKWFSQGKSDVLIDWIRRWEFEKQPVTSEQLAVLLADSFEGHEDTLRLSGRGGVVASDQAQRVFREQLDQLQNALAERSQDLTEVQDQVPPSNPEGKGSADHLIEDPGSLGSRPAKPKSGRGKQDRCSGAWIEAGKKLGDAGKDK